MPAHVRTGLAGQIHRRALEVLGAAPSARRDSGANAGKTLGVVEQRRVHLRFNVTWRNGVDRDTLGRPLVGEALGDLADGALGCGVGGNSEAALECEQRRKVDDAAAATGDGGGLELEHMGADVAAEGEDGVEVDLNDLELLLVILFLTARFQETRGTYIVEVAVGEFFARVTALDTGTVDQNANFVTIGQHLSSQPSNLLLNSHVCGIDPCLSAEFLDGVLGCCDGGVSLREEQCQLLVLDWVRYGSWRV